MCLAVFFLILCLLDIFPNFNFNIIIIQHQKLIQNYKIYYCTIRFSREFFYFNKINSIQQKHKNSIFPKKMNSNHKLYHSKASLKEIRPYSNYKQKHLSKDVCKSINIFPIKIQNMRQQDNFLTLNDSLQNFNSTTTATTIKDNNNNKQLKKFSIKQKISLKLDNLDEMKMLYNTCPNKDEIKAQQNLSLTTNAKRTSISITNTSVNNFISQQDSEKIFEKLRQNKDILMFDQSRLIMQANKFKVILNQFQNKIKQVRSNRDSLSDKVARYEHYFKEMKLKHIPQTDYDDENTQKNHQLKILNLQKKVQTLSYIIKQYRTNNKEEIKNFESKLKDFKPNIQKELTQKLAETNEKYQKLFKKVQFFETQCQKNLKLNWSQLIIEFQQTKQENQKNIEIVSQLSQKIQQLTEVMIKNEEKLINYDQLQEQIIQNKLKILKLNDLKLQLQESIQQKDQKLDQLNHLYEQVTFKLEGLKNLESRIENKDKTIKKNSLIINRLQSQNIQLKTKMDTVLGDFQQKVFCQKTLHENLLKANNSINQLTSRLHDSFLELSENSTVHLQNDFKQKQNFISHLFEKVKTSYNQIIAQYQNQIKIIASECENWKQTFHMISQNKEQRTKYIEKNELQLRTIQQKKLRCQESFTKLTGTQADFNQKDCYKCTHLMAYWGQLQNSYSQIKSLFQKMMKMQSQTQILSTSQKYLPSFLNQGINSRKLVPIY